MGLGGSLSYPGTPVPSDFFIVVMAVLDFMLMQLSSLSSLPNVYNQSIFRIFRVFKSLRALRAILVLRRLRSDGHGRPPGLGTPKKRRQRPGLPRIHSRDGGRVATDSSY